MRKPAIPTTLSVKDSSVATILRPIKENIEIITGIKDGEISTLLADATLTNVIDKLNEVIRRLNFNE